MKKRLTENINGFELNLGDRWNICGRGGGEDYLLISGAILTEALKPFFLPLFLNVNTSLQPDGDSHAWQFRCTLCNHSDFIQVALHQKFKNDLLHFSIPTQNSSCSPIFKSDFMLYMKTSPASCIWWFFSHLSILRACIRYTSLI